MSQHQFYIGTYTQTNSDGPTSEGIYRATLDTQSGTLSALELVAPVKNPSFLALGRDGRHLYAVCEIEGSAVAAWAIEESGLRFLGHQPSGGDGACHLSLNASGKHVLVANYGGGNVAAFPILEDGSLGVRSSTVQHTGSGPNANRQEKPHAHSIYGDEAGRYVYACDLGTDEVKIYHFEAEPGTLAPISSGHVPRGSGPRHLALHPRGFAYVNNDLGLSVSVFARDFDSGALTLLQTVPTLPANARTEEVSTAEIALHPGGDWLYVSNRGHESIAAFCIGGDGLLSLIGHFETPAEPRGFGLSPDGCFLVVGGQKAHQIAAFEIDAATGKLVARGENLGVGAPVCVVFAS